MPKIPDVTIYVEALRERIVGKALTGLRLQSPFVLRSVEPHYTAVVGREVTAVDRLAKRLVFSFGGDGELRVVIHLMIAGRLQWKPAPGAKAGGKIGLAAFDFADGTLLFTEASTKKRASLHVVSGDRE